MAAEIYREFHPFALDSKNNIHYTKKWETDNVLGCKGGIVMTKEEKKEILFGRKEESDGYTVTLMGHWNNDSGCRLD